jgi:polyhydroxyalkanoate synthase
MRTMVFPIGHIGIFVGSKSQKEFCPKITAWLRPRSLLKGKVKEKKNRKERVNKNET